MAAVIGKRKRNGLQEGQVRFKNVPAADSTIVNGKKKSQPKPKKVAVAHAEEFRDEVQFDSTDTDVSIQVVTGSYERVLHGVSATIPLRLLQENAEPSDAQKGVSTENRPKDDVTFSDTFLFAAHASSIRCLALSPPAGSDKRILATGSSDERINLYNLSTVAQKTNGKPSLPSLSGTGTAENPKNRSLGNLIHHERAITRLQFVTKSKLFSAAEDNTIAINRTRDWTVLSSIKAPIPKPQSRPSGDTAGPGEVPAGINDFAIHPSQKLMLSVGRGERCMRLWNLMTGKKAGVLNFDRDLLIQVGEGKHSSGEGKHVLWNEDGEFYVVGFEQGAVVFGIDSRPKAIIKATPPTKFHQMRFLSQTLTSKDDNVLAISTEDGRILFFDCTISSDQPDSQDALPLSNCIGQLGGRAAGIGGRIKDFEPLWFTKIDTQALLIVTGSSDGAIRLWTLFPRELRATRTVLPDALNDGTDPVAPAPEQVGSIIGTLETGNRITCLGGFVMDGSASMANGNDGEETHLGAAVNGDESESDEEDSE